MLRGQRYLVQRLGRAGLRATLGGALPASTSILGAEVHPNNRLHDLAWGAFFQTLPELLW